MLGPAKAPMFLEALRTKRLFRLSDQRRARILQDLVKRYSKLQSPTSGMSIG
jgi:hypothetical protein